ncbi:MAG: hypothetical protein WC330_07855 [Candidatus Omnitrophota bacterium]|jgi:hypothetical protein
MLTVVVGLYVVGVFAARAGLGVYPGVNLGVVVPGVCERGVPGVGTLAAATGFVGLVGAAAIGAAAVGDTTGAGFAAC